MEGLQIVHSMGVAPRTVYWSQAARPKPQEPQLLGHDGWTARMEEAHSDVSDARTEMHH